MGLFDESAWNSQDEIIALKAVKELTDQQLLAEVAKKAALDAVRFKAADKLADRMMAKEVFFDLANHSKDEDVRWMACNKAYGGHDFTNSGVCIYCDFYSGRYDKYIDHAVSCDECPSRSCDASYGHGIFCS